MRGQPGFFDIDERLKHLSGLGDQLEDFRSAIDFEIFRPELTTALCYSDGSQGGRPPFDPVMMFKILVIQAANNLSDERTEFLVNDRLSFMRFLGLSDRIPDARTTWLFREKLTKAGAISQLFERFDAMLRKARFIAMSGQIVDASLIAPPRQRNTGGEKKAIKEGRIPENVPSSRLSFSHTGICGAMPVPASQPSNLPVPYAVSAARRPGVRLSRCWVRSIVVLVGQPPHRMYVRG
jgi:IS5 family transposase